jgi:galactose oxidase-like protein
LLEFLMAMTMSGDGGSDDPAVLGAWEEIRYRFQYLPIHIALLRTGKVLAFGGSGNDELSFKSPHPAELWNPDGGAFQTVDQELAGDIFCAGQVALPDGKILVAGGTYQYDGTLFGYPAPPFSGLDQAYLFDPAVERWTRIQDMANGRWYPTLLALGDGRVMTVAGLTKSFPWVFLPTIEIYQEDAGWQVLKGADREFPLYPRLHLLPNGDVFYSGSYNTHYTFPFSLTGFPTSALDMKDMIWKVYGLPNRSEREEGTSTLLPLEPPDYEARVLLAGGGTPQGTQATNAVEIIDLSVDNPTWRQIQPMNFERYYNYAVILPDKNVFVLGGRVGTAEMNMGAAGPATMATADLPHDPAAILDTELFDYQTQTWTKMAKMTVDRLYHSNAILLPDGRVMAAGSNPARRVNELRIETFCPPYFYRGERPVIENYPAVIRYGSTFEVTASPAGEIGAVALIRPGATTHCVNTDQRYVGLTFESTNSSTLVATAPGSMNLAPTGYYMLFILTHDQIPSVGKFVKLE